MRLVALLLIVALAGCVEYPTYDVIVSHGCGMCAGNPDHPEFILYAITDDEHLRIEYAVGEAGRIAFADGFQGDRDRARDLFDLHRDAYGSQWGVTVHSMTTTAADHDRRELGRLIHDLDPIDEDGECDVTDYGPPSISVPAMDYHVAPRCGQETDAQMALARFVMEAA